MSAPSQTDPNRPKTEPNRANQAKTDPILDSLVYTIYLFLLSINLDLKYLRTL